MIDTQSRMLIGLSWMRERQPELYKARVEDFRMQRQIRAAGERLKQAKDAGDAAAEAAGAANTAVNKSTFGEHGKVFCESLKIEG